MTDFESKALKLFRAAVNFLRIDDEGCAPSEWPDIIRAANLCADIRLWALQGLLPTLAKSDPFFLAVESLEDVLGTFVVIAPSNAEVVTRWRAAWDGIAELEAA